MARNKAGFTLIELLVVIAIIAILAVVVVLTLNPSELLRQSRDANRVSDIATLTNALNLYTTDQSGASSFSLGNASDTYISVYDPSATSTAGDQCQGLSLMPLNNSTGQAWQCSPSSTYRNVNGLGWIPINLSKISAGSPIGSLPVDPTNQTSSGLFYSYNTNGNQFEVTANLESQKYKAQFGQALNTSLFPEIISGGTPTISSLYSPSGLVGYWPLNEGSSNIANDQSGNGDNGVWGGSAIGTGGTYYTGGKVGSYAGDFDGTSTYVLFPDISALQPSNITLSMWVMLSSSPYGFIIERPKATYASYGLIASASGTIDFIIGYTDSLPYVNNVVSNTALTPGIWYYVVGTYNGTAQDIYINGVQNATTSFSSPIEYGNTGSGPTGLRLGKHDNGSNSNGTFFPGSIDDVRIYNRALSPAEVMALYTAEH